MDQFLSLAALAFLVLLTRALRLSSHSWYSPGALFGAIWTVAVALPLVGAPEFPVWYPAVWLLVFFVAVFGAGATWGERRAMGRKDLPEAGPGFPAVLLRWLSLAGALLGVGAVQALLASKGMSILDLASLSSWLQVAAAYSADRYQYETAEPLLARLLSIGFYLGSLAGGFLWVRNGRRGDRVAALMPLLVALVHAAVLTTRAVFLYAATLFASGLLAAKVRRGSPLTRLATQRTALLAILGGAGVFLLFVVLQFARGGIEDVSRAPEIVDHLQAWFFGHLSAFSAWLHQYSPLREPLHLGQRTFGGIFQALGVEERVQGVFSELHELGGGHVTNIYTVFRSLIEDVGVPGTAMVLGLSGAAAGRLYGETARGSDGAQALLVVLYSALLWSPLASFLAYNTLLVTFALFWLATRAAAGLAQAPESSPESTT